MTMTHLAHLALRPLPNSAHLIPIPLCRVGLKFIANPSRFLNDTRVAHGDTFVLYMFGVKMLYTFSVKGAPPWRSLSVRMCVYLYIYLPLLDYLSLTPRGKIIILLASFSFLSPHDAVCHVLLLHLFIFGEY